MSDRTLAIVLTADDLLEHAPSGLLRRLSPTQLVELGEHMLDLVAEPCLHSLAGHLIDLEGLCFESEAEELLGLEGDA